MRSKRTCYVSGRRDRLTQASIRGATRGSPILPGRRNFLRAACSWVACRREQNSGRAPAASGQGRKGHDGGRQHGDVRTRKSAVNVDRIVCPVLSRSAREIIASPLMHSERGARVRWFGVRAECDCCNCPVIRVSPPSSGTCRRRISGMRSVGVTGPRARERVWIGCRLSRR